MFQLLCEPVQSVAGGAGRVEARKSSRNRDSCDSFARSDGALLMELLLPIFLFSSLMMYVLMQHHLPLQFPPESSIFTVKYESTSHESAKGKALTPPPPPPRKPTQQGQSANISSSVDFFESVGSAAGAGWEADFSDFNEEFSTTPAVAVMPRHQRELTFIYEDDEDAVPVTKVGGRSVKTPSRFSFPNFLHILSFFHAFSLSMYTYVCRHVQIGSSPLLERMAYLR